MTRRSTAGPLVGIALWLVATTMLYLTGEVNLAITFFLAGGNAVMVAGSLLIRRYRSPRMALKPRLLNLSAIAFALSATFFTYSYLLGDTNIPFYVALTLTILGMVGWFNGVKRIRESRV